MGIIKQGLLGGVSGSVGPTVGSSWKGIPVLKAKPLSVANPRTAGQVAQRTKMSNIVAFAQIILASVIKPLWDRFAQQASGYNEFVSANIGLFSSATPSSPGDFVISRGKMAATEISTFTIMHASNEVLLAWPNDSGEGLKLATDEAYAVLVNDTTGEVKGYSAVGERSTTFPDALTMDAINAGDTIHGYLAFRRADGTVVSASSYITATA